MSAASADPEGIERPRVKVVRWLQNLKVAIARHLYGFIFCRWISTFPFTNALYAAIFPSLMRPFSLYSFTRLWTDVAKCAAAAMMLAGDGDVGLQESFKPTTYR